LLLQHGDSRSRPGCSIRQPWALPRRSLPRPLRPRWRGSTPAFPGFKAVTPNAIPSGRSSPPLLDSIRFLIIPSPDEPNAPSPSEKATNIGLASSLDRPARAGSSATGPSQRDPLASRASPAAVTSPWPTPINAELLARLWPPMCSMVTTSATGLLQDLGFSDADRRRRHSPHAEVAKIVSRCRPDSCSPPSCRPSASDRDKPAPLGLGNGGFSSRFMRRRSRMSCESADPRASMPRPCAGQIKELHGHLQPPRAPEARRNCGGHRPSEPEERCPGLIVTLEKEADHLGTGGRALIMAVSIKLEPRGLLDVPRCCGGSALSWWR